MHYDHNHYFVDLFQDAGLDSGMPLSSGTAAGLRIERARDFVKVLRGWLDDQLLSDEVSALKVTVLGRVMLTCTAALVERLEELEWPEVMAITAASRVPAVPSLHYGRTA